MPDEKSLIYRISHKSLTTPQGSPLSYIGESASEERARQHMGDLRYCIHHSKYLQYAWYLFGADAFEFRVIGWVPTNERLSKQYHWVEVYKAHFITGGFNIRPKAGVTAQEEQDFYEHKLKPDCWGDWDGGIRGRHQRRPTNLEEPQATKAANPHVKNVTRRETPRSWELAPYVVVFLQSRKGEASSMDDIRRAIAPTLLANGLRERPQALSYGLNYLIKEGWIERPGRKSYAVTPAGRRPFTEGDRKYFAQIYDRYSEPSLPMPDIET